MFEKILENILLNNVGQFIDGIDKNNLKIGIWSGDIVIQNIAVKPEVIAKLDLPFRMKFSFVSKLSVSVPWKSLGSKPVEIMLEDVYIILEPVSQEAWRAVDFTTVNKRIELMESFVQSYMSKIAEKLAQENKDVNKEQQKGMVGKITERVIDNIQITIRNIHVRFENALSKRKYAWGLTLDEIMVYTTNKKWDKEFIDRTEAKNRLEPMRKRLSLKNLGVYWASNIQDLFGDLPPQQIKQYMKDLILKDHMPPQQRMQYIIGISAVCQLIQKNKKDPNTAGLPEFDISLDLKPLNVQLRKPQLEDVIRLLEFTNSYQKFKFAAMKEREKATTLLSEEEKTAMKEDFKRMFIRILSNEKAQDLKLEPRAKVTLETQEEYNRFINLMMTLPDSELSMVIKEVIKDVEREKRTRAVEAQKIAQNEKKGWFGSKKANDPNQVNDPNKLDEKDIETIEKYIQDTFGEDEQEDTAAKLKQIAYQPLLAISFTLEGGAFYLSDFTSERNVEGVMLTYQGLSSKIELNSLGKYVNVTLKDYGLFMRTGYAGAVTYTDTPIIRRLNHWMPPDTSGNMISLTFEQNPQGKEFGTYITLDSQAVEIVYRAVAIERLINFFNVSTEDETLKSKAYNQLEKVQDKASQAAKAVQSSLKKQIFIKFAAPVLVIPFLQNADVHSECWVANLGDLLVDTEELDTGLHERFNLELRNLKFQYFPTHDLYMKVSKSLIEENSLGQLKPDDHEEYKKVFNLIQQFNIDILIDKMLAGKDKEIKALGKPKMSISITIPSLDLQLNPQMYKNLLRTKEFVRYSKEAAMELMEDEHNKLMNGSFKIGTVYVRETKYRNVIWNQYLCYFKGAYLYFFKNLQDLRPSFTYYIRDANILYRPDLERPFAFMIENRRNTGFLACVDQNDMMQWMTMLSQKIREYQAINLNVFEQAKPEKTLFPNPPTTGEQIPENQQQQQQQLQIKPQEQEQEQEQEQQVLPTPITPMTTTTDEIDYSMINMELTFQIKEVKLALHVEKDTKLFDLDTKNFIVKFQQQPGQTQVRIKLEYLDIIDYPDKYHDPKLKKLATSVRQDQDSQAQATDLIEVFVKTLDKSHPDYSEAKTGTQVSVKFGYLFLNMKPETVSQTLKLFIAPPDENSQIKPAAQDDTAIYPEDSDHTMLKIKIELQEVSVKLIHQRTLVCMNELAISHALIAITKKPLSTNTNIILGNIQLFNMTNYPDTIDSNLEYEKVQPYELVGVGEASKNILEFDMTQYNPKHPLADNINKVYTTLDIKISSIRVNYLQQPVLRLVDYIQWQLLPTVRPYKYDMVLMVMPKHIGEQNLANIQFMDIKIHIQSPIVTLKPLPTSTNYLEIRLGDIALQNGIVKDTERFKNPCVPLEFVYCEKYDIKLSDMVIYRVEGENRVEISKRTQFGLELERTLMYDEYNAVYRDGQPEDSKERFHLDMSMKMKGKITPIIMLLQREDYLMIMRCVFCNIQYDDVKDKMFISNISMEFTNQGRLATPLNIQLIFENFTLLAFKGQEELPFTMINFHQLGIVFMRDGKKNSDINITSIQLNGSFFENEDGQNLVERKMLGALDKVNVFPLQDVSQESIIESIINSTRDYAEEISMTNSIKNLKNDQLTIKIQMQPTGDKVIRIHLYELKMYLVTSIYLNLASFVRMNDSVYPASRLLQMQQANNPANQGGQPQASMTVTIDTRNILITVPSTILKSKDTPNVLALKGDLSFIWARYPTPSLEESVDDVKRRNFTRATEQCAQFNEVGRMSISLNKFEIFVCEFADLLSSMNFNQVKKRNMVLPFSLIFIKKSHQVLNKERTELIPVTKNEVNVERLIFRLSYQDVNVLANSFQYQKEQLQKTAEASAQENNVTVANQNPPLPPPAETKPLEETKEDFSQNVSSSPQTALVEQQITYDPDDWLANVQEFNIASKGFQIVLINDVEGSLVPVLEFTIFEYLATMLKINHKLRMDARLVMNCSYYNPLPSKWEPFIEKFGLNIHFAKGDNPKTSLMISSIEEIEEINMNISEEMVAILYSTIHTWKEDYQQRKNIIQEAKLGKSMIMQSGSKFKEENVIEYVSPYRILNYTGYPIEIYADLSSQQKTTKTRKGSTQVQESYHVENGGIVQYLVESDIDKIFERSSDDMFIQTNKIRVKLKHPRYELSPVVGIDIDRPNVTGFSVNIRDPKSSPEVKFSLFSSVKIEQSKKIITLTSPYHITNKVFRVYILTFESETGQTLEVRLDKGETTSVPLDFIKGNVSLRLDAPEAKGSDKIPVQYLAKLADKTMELRADYTSFVLLKSTKIDPACEFYEISLLPPFEVKNCCGLDLFYRFSNTTETIMETSTMKPQETLHETKLPSEHHVYLQIRLQGYYWSEKFLVHSSDSRNKLAKEVLVMDATGKFLNILVFTPQNEIGSRKILLYTKTCIVNETPFDIFAYTVEDRKLVQIPGQLPTDTKEVFNSKVTLYNEINTMAFGKKKQKEYSEPVNVGTMGSTATELVNLNGSSMLDVGINMSLLRCDKAYNLFTKIITISPRFILLNKTDYVLEIKRDCSQQTMGIILKDIRTPYYWSNWDSSMKDKSICIRPIESVEDAEKWSWSNGFDIQAVGLYNYLVFGKDRSQMKFFKTSVSLESSTLFVVIEEEKIETPTFKIRNDCPDLEITVWQANSGSYLSQPVRPGETIPWAWAYPNMKKEILAAFSSEQIAPYHDPSLGFSFDNLNNAYKLRIPVTKESRLRVDAFIVVEGSTRILKFVLVEDRRITNIMTYSTSSIARQPSNVAEEIINTNIEVNIKGLGISIISSLTTNKQQRIKERREVLYILLRGIDFRMINSSSMKYSQLRVKFLNIDNNTSYDTSFPVLLTPTKPKDLESGTKNYFLDTLIVQRVTPEVTFYETVQLLLDASTIQVDGMFIDAIIEVVQRFREVLGRLDESDSKRTIAQILYNSTHGAKKLQNRDYFENKFDWVNRELSEFAGGNLYIKKLILNALFFNISFQLKKKDASEDGFFLLSLLTSVLGTALANLDNAPLTLSGIVLENVFDSKQAIKKKIIDKYKDEATRSIPKLIGSLDIVGNPVGLFNNISTGVVDLVEKPMQGFLQGPLEGGVGIVMGASSLMKNTVSGTFNSIGKVTGSLASGLSNLAMDDEYLAQREKGKLRRPKHVGEGVVQGVTSLFKGVGEGVTGVFTKPIEGAAKGGLMGFFKGAFQGVTGLVVKPVTGILDAASNTAEGIKNTATAFDQKPNEERMRYPRAFYGKHKYYRGYADTDAQALWLLHFDEMIPQEYKKISILNAVDVVPDSSKEDVYYILVISFEMIIWWGVKEEKVIWAIQTKNLEKVIQYNGGLIFQLKQATERFKDRQIDLKNNNALQNTFIYKKLAELAEFVKQQ